MQLVNLVLAKDKQILGASAVTLNGTAIRVGCSSANRGTNSANHFARDAFLHNIL